MKFNDWLKNDDLSGKILICSDVKNGNRLIRKCNRDGICRVNTECKHMSDIAREIIIGNAAKNGRLVPFKLLDNSSCAVIIDRIIRNNSDKLPFFKKESMCSSAAAEIMRVINVIRMNKVTEQLMTDNEENITCLRTLIAMYHSELAAMGAYDCYTLIRSAADIAEPITDVGFGLAEGTQLTDIEMLLLEKISDGRYEKIELFDKSVIKPTFFAGRGYINEVRYIAESIKNKPFGEVNVFFTAEAYRSFIKAGLGSLKIPYTFSSPYPAAETDIVSFMLCLLRWAENGFVHSDLENAFINPKMTVSEYYFYRSASDISWGMGSYEAYCKKFRQEHPDADENNEEYKLVLFCEALIDIFSDPETKRSPVKLFERLTKLAGEFTGRKNPERKLVIPALKELSEQLSFMGDDAVPENEVMRFLIDRLEHMTVSEAERTDAVSVSVIGSGIVSERKYNYICGLSVSDLLPKVTESPVMSDEQLLKYVINKANSETSENRRQRQYHDPEFLIRSILADKDSELYLGYSSYDLSRLTECPPSVFYKKLCVEFGATDVTPLGYDELILGNIKLPSDKKWDPVPANGNADAKPSEKMYTPSMIDKILECPMKYFFIYKLDLREVNFARDSGGKWLAPNEKGNLFHNAACEYAERVLKDTEPAKVSENADEKILTEIFDRIVNGYPKPCENPEIRRLESEELKAALLNYFNSLHKELHDGSKWIVSECEGEFSGETYTLNYKDADADKTLDLTIEGRFDRIDHYIDPSTGTEHLRVIDYKTGGKPIDLKEHSQHVLYTAAMKKDNREVEVFSYETPFQNQKGEECKGSVLEGFDSNAAVMIGNVIDKNRYEYTKNTKPCEYCRYKDVCFKNTREDM